MCANNGEWDMTRHEYDRRKAALDTQYEDGILNDYERAQLEDALDAQAVYEDCDNGTNHCEHVFERWGQRNRLSA